MNKVTRALLATTSAALVISACGGSDEGQPAQGVDGVAREAKVLHVYNWSDYIAENTIPDFERQTGIKVTYDVFDSNDVLETRLLAGNSGFDVVTPSASFLERQIKAGVFQKLDKSQLPNLVNMDPQIMEQVAQHDPGNDHAIPYMWGTTGVGYNEAMVKKALDGATPDSWDYIFDPKLAARLADCGVSLLDAPDEILKSVLVWMGRDPNSQRLEDLKAAEEKLAAIRPYVRKIHSSQYIDDLANGEVCVAVGWSGDVLQARDRAEEAGRGVKVGYVIPKEGAILWFDVLAIPADAKHPGAAHAFINYLMDPQVAADNSNFVNYANANRASLPMVSEKVRNDPGVYPPPEVQAKLFPSLAYGEEFQRAMNRMWTKFSTGR
ncbi:MAG TPA: polyamine ABC transporter substrate-binding protein [Steroidobacter sp.]|jgi:putrescine transport system substrate-binding protein|nr:polyamine ABC transporter substrate-binding protein [Steroidobacteraceae bacterium]HLS80454.1 polyamine ABC transporter substrate-binding protein [Steroidobacter sp.]